MSVGPRLEEFNVVSNDHGCTQKCDFCVSVRKSNFTDHHTPYTINGFKGSNLVCKMHDWYCTGRYAEFRGFQFLLIKPSYQAMQVIVMVIQNENKALENAFKRN